MTGFAARMRPFILAAFCLVLAGCFDAGEDVSDDDKNPFFIKGRSRLSALDNDGAMEAFGKALEANPNSAGAHLELGILYEKKNDYAAAIYHFERHLKLRPESNVAESVRDRVSSCMLEIAKKVPFALISKSSQDQLSKLLTENADLRKQTEELKLSLAQSQAAAAAAATQAAQAAQTPANPNPIQQNPPPSRRETAAAPRESQTSARQPRESTASPSQRANSSAAPAGSSSRQPPSSASASRARTHRVQRGETLFSIAHRYGTTIDALRAANPGLNPRKIIAGQSIRIPGN